MRKEEKIMQIEMEYMERFERGEAPTLEELVERYPDMRDELIDFVFDFVTLRKATEQAELSEEELASVSLSREKAIEKALKPVGSFKELRVIANESLKTLAKAVHLPVSVLDGLERGMIVLDSVPAKLFERLGSFLGRAPAEIRALLEAGNRQLRPVHWKAEAMPKGRKRKAVSFEEALRTSKEFKASEEEYSRDWLSEAG
jgi:hypothetical protein